MRGSSHNWVKLRGRDRLAEAICRQAIRFCLPVRGRFVSKLDEEQAGAKIMLERRYCVTEDTP